jgi:6-pyruvoyltetrahydropterin/6-carboxytetrahydropterin synthase
MITIRRSYEFESAHFLPNVPEGHKCRNMHGHNYRLVVSVRGELDERGFVRDFAEVDEAVEPLLALLDHKVLNDTIENPTAENIARWFLSRLPFAIAVGIFENERSEAEARIPEGVKP